MEKKRRVVFSDPLRLMLKNRTMVLVMDFDEKQNVTASLKLIDVIDRRIDASTARLPSSSSLCAENNISLCDKS